jgi:hypothetical protein
MSNMLEFPHMSRNLKIVFGVACIALFVLGYAFGRGYKTYEINLKEKQSQLTKVLEEKTIPSNIPTIVTAANRVNPKVNVGATKDKLGNYNLKIDTQAFYFTPYNIGKAPQQNTGFANIFVNGKNIGFAYSEIFNISTELLKNGTNTVTVTLNANDGSLWLTKDKKEVKTEVYLVK